MIKQMFQIVLGLLATMVFSGLGVVSFWVPNTLALVPFLEITSMSILGISLFCWNGVRDMNENLFRRLVILVFGSAGAIILQGILSIIEHIIEDDPGVQAKVYGTLWSLSPGFALIIASVIAFSHPESYSRL